MADEAASADAVREEAGGAIKADDGNSKPEGVLLLMLLYRSEDKRAAAVGREEMKEGTSAGTRVAAAGGAILFVPAP